MILGAFQDWRGYCIYVCTYVCNYYEYIYIYVYIIIVYNYVYIYIVRFCTLNLLRSSKHLIDTITAQAVHQSLRLQKLLPLHRDVPGMQHHTKLAILL